MSCQRSCGTLLAVVLSCVFGACTSGEAGGSSPGADSSGAAPSNPASRPTSAPAAPPAAAAAKTRIEHVDAAGAAALLRDHPDTVVVDVRTPGEFETGRVAGARNVDFRDEGFATALEGLDRQATHLVYCRSGGRSTGSLEAFKQLGFAHVVHLDGGMIAWNEAGQPVEK
ncbi:MAG: rhodanese-like domain-containing protein [Planctomycetota bacterium]